MIEYKSRTSDGFGDENSLFFVWIDTKFIRFIDKHFTSPLTRIYVLILTQREHFGHQQPPFISPSLGFALHTIEEGVFCQEMIKI
jgi:hypothetical protein